MAPFNVRQRPNNYRYNTSLPCCAVIPKKNDCKITEPTIKPNQNSSIQAQPISLRHQLNCTSLNGLNYNNGKPDQTPYADN